MLVAMGARGLMENTQLYIFGDHGMGWDVGRGSAQMKQLGFRTHYEHIDVPLIVSPTKRVPCDIGMHDGMSISATMLDELNISPHPSFKGKSLYEPGKPVAIVESVGRGNCDVLRRDLYFTVTSTTHRLMVLLTENKLIPERLYDRTTDPKEYVNLVDNKENATLITTMLRWLIEQRGELLQRRGVDIESLPAPAAKNAGETTNHQGCG